MNLKTKFVESFKSGFSSALHKQESPFAIRRKSHSFVEAALCKANQMLLPSLTTSGAASAKGVAEEFLQSPYWSKTLRSIPHLGCLQPLGNVSASRYDYTCLIIDSLLELKKRHPGLGLGSKVKLDTGRSISGLELAQSWAVLLNAGHLFGTFATERALLYEIFDDRRQRTSLLQGITDQELRTWASSILETRIIQRAAVGLVPLHLGAADSREQSALLKGILLKYPAFDGAVKDRSGILWAYRTARQLAYNRLHALIRLGPHLEATHYDEFLESVRESGELGFCPIGDMRSPTLELLRAFDEVHAERVFTSPLASHLVLQHIRQFKVWWRAEARRKIGVADKVQQLWSEPADWPKLPIPDEPHYVRLGLPGRGIDWFDEVKDLRQSKVQWDGNTFLVSPARGSGVFLDVFAEKLSCALAYRLAKHIAERNLSTWTSEYSEQSATLWRSIAKFCMRLLRELLREDVSIVLDPAPTDSERTGWAVAATDRTKAVGRARDFVSRTTCEKRVQELRALVDFMETLGSRQQPTILVLGATRVLSKSSQRELGDLDGVWVEFAPDHLTWHFLECKNGRKQGSGASQLEGLLAKALNRENSTASTTTLGGQSIAHVEVRVPALGTSPA